MWLNFKQLIYKWRSCVTTSWELWEHFMFYSAFLLTTQFIVDPSKDGQYHNYTRACACTRVYINMWLIFVYTNEGSNIGQSDKHEMICSVWTLVHVLPSWIGLERVWWIIGNCFWCNVEHQFEEMKMLNLRCFGKHIREHVKQELDINENII